MRRLALVALLALEPCGALAAEEDAAVRALSAAIDTARAQSLLELARGTVAAVASGRPLPAPADGGMLGCGAFVTLVGPRGMRGCYGDLNAGAASLEDAILDAARGAASRDLRFRPVKPSEVAGLTVILSLTLSPEPVADAGSVDPDRYGVLVTAGSLEALLLPGEARTAAWGLAECLRKAGIRAAEPTNVFRFRTLTFISRGAPCDAR